ncbi:MULTISPECIES: TatD family hydrolase [Gammaproteobacteria]|uniref:TatD family hydrolase n=1 Tax=Gammaproteobacteria TaxID=1236 RepID=UPI000DD04C03|nr:MULTISPECIES: TatD family hydrolase [Gammaproteobacteria]RTE87274.1 TatD family deoxyribonuclease [Aliidiomarina sp. B3213]TCZ92939.1 TatD family deoxyribonuclease [Lysobacter sp. N42]
MQFVDSHCHLDKIKHAKPADILREAKSQNVEHVLCVGVTLEDYPEMREAVGNPSGVSFSCGVHPLYMEKGNLDEAVLRECLQDDRVVAVGETGLDYYYDKEYHQKQQDSFARHIEIACEVDKPLIIHTRDAREHTIGMLKEGGAERCSGVLHCFTESLEMAKQAIDLGFYISISGIATFNNAKKLREVVKALPIDRMLIETDSPWLAPVPHRGKENQPGFVPHVAQCIAGVKGISVAEVAEQTRTNFYDLFKLAKGNGQL